MPHQQGAKNSPKTQIWCAAIGRIKIKTKDYLILLGGTNIAPMFW